MTTIAANRTVSGPRGSQPQGGAVAIDPVRIVKMYWIPLVLSLFVGVGLGVGTYLVLLRVAPRFESTALYEALAAETTIRETGVGGSREELERFVNTQVITITNDSLLKVALQKAEVLTTDWSKAYLDNEGRFKETDALKDFKELVAARPRTGSAYFSFTVRASKNSDSSALAAAVHRAYFEELASRKLKITNEKMVPMNDSIQALTKLVEAADSRIRQIMANNSLEDTGERGGASAGEVEIGSLQPRRAEALQRQAAVEQRLVFLMGNQAAEGGMATYTDEQRESAERDPIVLNVKQRLTEYQISESAMATRGLGETHPERVRMMATIRATEAEIARARSAALDKLFRADLENSQRQSQSVKDEIRDMDRRIELLKADKVKIAQAYVELSSQKVKKQQHIEEIDRLNRAMGNLQELASLSKGDRIDRIRLAQAAATPDELAFPRLPIMVIFGVIGALGLTLGLVVLRELLDTRIRTPADVNLIARGRLLGFIPRADEDPTRPATPETVFRDSPTGAMSESFRQLRSGIIKKMQASNQKSLLIVPAAPGSGATTVVSNLALGAAASDLRVLVIDGNLRRPGLHKVFKLADGPGLADVLAKKCDLSMALQATSTPNLTLLSAGSATLRSVPERLSAEVLTATLDEAHGKFDLVIIDCAPALVAGDAQALANRCDAAILVVKAYGEKRGQVARLRDQLAEGRAEVLGIIVNQVRAAAGGYMRKNIQMAYDYQTAGTPN